MKFKRSLRQVSMDPFCWRSFANIFFRTNYHSFYQLFNCTTFRMNKPILLGAVALTSLVASATDYPFMVIRDTAGKECVVKSDGLRFSVDGSRLVVTHSEGEASFDFSELRSMAFAVDPAGVEPVGADSCAGVEVYTSTGIRVGWFDSMAEAECNLPESGVYIFKGDKETVKVAVK